MVTASVVSYGPHARLFNMGLIGISGPDYISHTLILFICVIIVALMSPHLVMDTMRERKASIYNILSTWISYQL